MTNYDDKIKELKGSPIFNLSLSSKELFHSNFIAWICENYPLEFGSLIINKFELNVQNKNIISTKRELKSLDLIIEFKNKKVIIENKVKSAPNREQLINYKSKNNSENVFILLTLIEPNFNVEEIGWELFSYKDLSELLEKLINTISIEYHKLIISDYSNFIRILYDLNKLMTIDFRNDYFDFYGEKYKLFQSVRLHDLYLKSSYERLIHEIGNYLRSKIKNYKIITGNRYSHEINKNQIVISTTIVNGKGVVNIDYSNENEIIYGIMLDGGRYNQYIYVWGNKAENIIETANMLQNDKMWFSFTDIPIEEVYPKKGKKYNKFGNNMLYRSIKIKSRQTFISIFEQIHNDLNRII